jgi:hypothetical protein
MIGGSAGIGLESARTRAEGAEAVLTAQGLPTPIDHVLVIAGRPYYGDVLGA